MYVVDIRSKRAPDRQAVWARSRLRERRDIISGIGSRCAAEGVPEDHRMEEGLAEGVYPLYSTNRLFR
jgi:hypothetical protein